MCVQTASVTVWGSGADPDLMEEQTPWWLSTDSALIWSRWPVGQELRDYFLTLNIYNKSVVLNHQHTAMVVMAADHCRSQVDKWKWK